MSNDFVNLTTIRERLKPEPRPTAIEEWRRQQRAETVEIAVAIVAGVAVAFGLAWTITAISGWFIP